MCSKFCGRDPKLWEDWIFAFEEKKQLDVRKYLAFLNLYLNVTLFF